MADLVYSLEGKKDARASDVKKALEKWGRVEIVEASFRGEENLSRAVSLLTIVFAQSLAKRSLRLLPLFIS